MEYLTLVRPIIYLCKMADRQVLLSDPLCFLFTKFGKLDIKRIKTALLDFIQSIQQQRNAWLRTPECQPSYDGGTVTISYQRECDDMVDIITFLDERKVLSIVLRYAFDCSDHFPSAHLDEDQIKSKFIYIPTSIYTY